MEIIRGKQASFMDTSALVERLTRYNNVHIDLGTGDGRFAQHMARTSPTTFVMGIDACRENLQDVSRRAAANAMFVIANARALPSELDGLATHITINFPWGSLLEGLLMEDAGLLSGLIQIAKPKTTLEVRLNGGAMAEAGWALEAGAERVQSVLAGNGFRMQPIQAITTNELKAFPTTWAKRIAYGRDPRAVYLRGEQMAIAVAQHEYVLREAI